MARKPTADVALFRSQLARLTREGEDVAEYLVETLTNARSEGGTPVGNDAAKTILAYLVGKPSEHVVVSQGEPQEALGADVMRFIRESLETAAVDATAVRDVPALPAAKEDA